MAQLLGAGDYDRRIEIEIATMVRDASNDVVPSWAPAFKRWAKRMGGSAGSSIGREVVARQQVVRDVDTVFVLRYDSESLAIAPESHRIRYQGAIFEIIGIDEGTGRRRELNILCCSRPDKIGARGADTTSQGSP